MTDKYHIQMSNHAKERALERGIKEADIEMVINNPIETIYDTRFERYKSYGKAIDPYTKKPVYLIIIHNAFNKYVRIITAMYANSPGGLKAHGFSNI
jgi:uncharacterized DUF497 family protein